MPTDPQKGVRPPGEFIREELRRRGWTQEDLARILNRPIGRVNEIIQGKQGVSPEVAVDLGTAFGTAASVWLEREAAYRLAHLKADTADVLLRARLHGFAPLKEMQRRGWIPATDDYGELERALCLFFGVATLNEEPIISAVMRKTAPHAPLSPAQRAWCCRVRQIAGSLKVGRFNPDRLDQCTKELKKLAAYPAEVRKVPNTLAAHGVRFLVVEPLSGGKIDGAALWLDPESPVIAVSLRYDRFDSFWHTLAHEWSHIRHGDALSVDNEMVGPDQTPTEAKPDIEKRADREAAAMLIPPDELDSFILRVAPMYAENRIVQFAHRIKVYPGIIVGQLQHRGEIGWQSNRKWLVKVRDSLTAAVITDGWGHTIDRRVLE